MAYRALCTWGETQFSPVFQIPCRDGIGRDYWNSACILISEKTKEQIETELKQLEKNAGRVRPSHQISLDIDLIAWGKSLEHMQFNQKKLPLADDVKIPLFELWSCPEFCVADSKFPKVQIDTSDLTSASLNV